MSAGELDGNRGIQLSLSAAVCFGIRGEGVAEAGSGQREARRSGNGSRIRGNVLLFCWEDRIVLSRKLIKKQPGRKWLTAVAALALLGGTLLAGAVALATTPAGLFELEGNAVTDNTVPGSDDWDRVCHEVTGSDCNTTSNTTTATAVAWTTDTHGAVGGLSACTGNNCTIFTGGGSKDPIDINQWAWKDNVGGLPDKDNLQHGFAARYSIPSSTACPGPNGDTSGTTSCDMLFFGNDRFDNSGDAQQGFWFFQNKIGLGANAVGGGNGFSSSNTPEFHKLGDLLLISDFSNGGATSTITVYTWDPGCLKTDIPKSGPVGGVSCGDANLRFQGTSTLANCDGGGGIDPAISGFCGVVNNADGTVAPWTFLDKSGNNSYLSNEFYEGGVNLSHFNLQSECFASVASETRSSQSTTATLKDFVLGSFGDCTAHLTTQVSSSSVNPSTPVTDTATVTGNRPNITPSGNITFFLCSFASGTTDVCDDTDSSHHGTAVGSPVALSGSGAVATATSAAVNTAANPLAPGRYCFRAEWPGDSNYVGAKKEFDGATECFTVVQSSTTTVTKPQVGGSDVAGDVIIGTNVTDHAVITGATGFGNVTGTVNFFVCDPTQTTGASGSERCQTGGTAAGSKSATPVAAANPPKSTADSDPVTANLTGVWCFRAEYVSDTPNYTGSSDSAHTECFNVINSPTTTATTPQVSGANVTTVSFGTTVTDHALVTGATGFGDVTGTVNFFVCDPTQTTGASGSERCQTGGTAAGSKSATPVAASDPPQSTADSDGVVANQLGVWCFRAEYVSNTNHYTNSSDSAHTECFSVTTTSSGTSAQRWLPNDRIVVTSVGTSLAGHITVTLRSGSCAGSIVYTDASNVAFTATTSGAVYNTQNTTYFLGTLSDGTAGAAAGTYYWSAVFTPDSPSATGASTCENSVVTINN